MRRALLIILVATPTCLWATVQPASPFTDHMVLQRDLPVPVWGTSAAGERVTVRFGRQTKSTRADHDGKWRVDLPPLQTSAVGSTFRISGSRTAHDIVFADVLVGEVWLASGQSNMVFTISKSRYPWAGVVNEELEFAAANYPQIRMFTGEASKTLTPQEHVAGEWLVASPETVPGFSAIGYFFARNLQQQIKVPIGILALAYGASTAEAWIPRETLAADAQLSPMLDRFDQLLRTYRPPTDEELNLWQAAADKAQAANDKPPPRPHPDPVQDQHNATVLFNGMIHPVIPYAIRGVIWYQGESIVGGAQGRALYPHVQTTLIQDWRRQWRNERLPFYICELAGMETKNNLPAVREAQATVLELPNTGMAVTHDIGDAQDVHPHNKQDVGERLSRIALANTYGRDIEFSGPSYQSMRIEGPAIRLTFSHVAGGLVAKGGPLKWFEVAGVDGNYVAADARVDGNGVVVSSTDVPAPVAARYAWLNFPDGANFYNEAGLPAPPFRTDKP